MELENVFRAYDIRGIYPARLDEEFAYLLGRAAAAQYSGVIVVGGDARLSTPALKEKFIRGLLEGGAKVIDVGLTTTPIIPFAINHFSANLGVNITASHNPKDYNGFKFFDHKGLAIGFEDGLSLLKERIKKRYFTNGEGSVEKQAVFEDYKEFLLSKVAKLPSLKVVVDCGNGVAGAINPHILKAAGLEVVELFTEVDGRFPNHEADPSKSANLKDLREKVKEVGADLGFGYDGDGDRLGVVDKDGEIIEPIVIFSILIKHALKIAPGSKIVKDALTSKKIQDVVLREGGKPITSKVGHTFIMKKMKQTGAELGGELSGHYYFKEIGGVDDALFASLKLIEALSSLKKPISKFREELPHYFSAVSEEQRITIKGDRFAFIRELAEELESKGYKIDTLDGVKVLFPHGWAMFRPSNTEPKIAYAYESSNQREFEEIQKFVEKILRRVDENE